MIFSIEDNEIHFYFFFSQDDPETSEAPEELSKEEILEEMTLALRRTMTEILLEVTNEEIFAITNDVMKSVTEKRSKSSVRKSGLQGVIANYGSDDEPEPETDSDSDGDLQSTLKKKKRWCD